MYTLNTRTHGSENHRQPFHSIGFAPLTKEQIIFHFHISRYAYCNYIFFTSPSAWWRLWRVLFCMVRIENWYFSAYEVQSNAFYVKTSLEKLQIFESAIFRKKVSKLMKNQMQNKSIPSSAKWHFFGFGKVKIATVVQMHFPFDLSRRKNTQNGHGNKYLSRTAPIKAFWCMTTAMMMVVVVASTSFFSIAMFFMFNEEKNGKVCHLFMSECSKGGCNAERKQEIAAPNWLCSFSQRWHGLTQHTYTS